MKKCIKRMLTCVLALAMLLSLAACVHIQDMLHQDALEPVVHFDEHHGVSGQGKSGGPPQQRRKGVILHFHDFQLISVLHRFRRRGITDPIFFSDFNKFNGHSKIIAKTLNTQ